MQFKWLVSALADASWSVWKRSTLHWDRDDRRQIYLEVDPQISVRTCRALLIFFNLAGYQVRLRGRWKRWSLSMARALVWHHNTRLLWRRPSAVRPRILCTDRSDDAMAAEGGAEKVIHLCYDYGPDLDLGTGHFAMPIPMHCQIYVQYQGHAQLEAFRPAPRKFRIVFAGNWQGPGYCSPLHAELYGKLNRAEIIRYVQSRPDTCAVSSQQGLQELQATSHRTGLVLLDPHLRIPQERWLEFVSQADFFLCPPGFPYPWSHNAVEALAVGTIPFLNYTDWFYPRLRHLENCLVFSSFEDLGRGLDQILAMPADEVGRLRAGAVAYYDEHLAPDRFVQNLMDHPAKHVYLHTWDEKEGALRQIKQASRPLCNETP
jgi:hypothetical protein